MAASENVRRERRFDMHGVMRHLPLMLSIRRLKFGYGKHVLFDNTSATIPYGARVGVVGRNGVGKTTLFKLLVGEVEPEEGSIVGPEATHLALLRQETDNSGQSVFDFVLSKDFERTGLLAEAETASDPFRLADIHTRLADIEAFSAEARAATILAGLGFEGQSQQWPLPQFSGGWQMRAALAATLFASPRFLLLDEPSNYLDLEGAIWLESFLANYRYSFMLISHDRRILERSCNSVLHIHNRKLDYYSTSYGKFLKQQALRKARIQAQVKTAEANRKHMQKMVDRFRYKASKARQAQSRLKMIARLEAETPALEKDQQVVFTFPSPANLAPPLLSINNCSLGYAATRILGQIKLYLGSDDRVALLGPNGSGKSTLAKLLAGQLKPHSGTVTRAKGLRTGFFAQHRLEELRAGQSPLEHIALSRPDEPPQNLRTRLASFGLGEELADLPVRDLSGGQKTRLSLALVLANDPHLLILDEPTNHLDVYSREALARGLNEFTGAVAVISHDFHFLAMTSETLWLIRDGAVSVYGGDLESYSADILTAKGPRAVRKPAKEHTKGKSSILAELRSRLKMQMQNVENLQNEVNTLDKKLSNPAFYRPDNADKTIELQRRYREVRADLESAEEAYLQTMARIELAEAGPGVN